MRSSTSTSVEPFTCLCLTLLSALGLFAMGLLSPDFARAQKPASIDPGQGMPGIVVSPRPDAPTPRPDIVDAVPTAPDLRLFLRDEDATAALEHIRFALTDVADGSTYLWHRHHGRLSGSVKPTMSFVAGSGRLCRHIVTSMTAGGYTRQTEGVACRLETGRWQLEG